MQPLHDVVEGGPLCRLRLQAAAHEVDYVLELLPRGVGCTGRQHVAFFRQLQLLFTSAIILYQFRNRQVRDSLVRNAALQNFVHDHAERVNFAQLTRL